MDIRIKKCVIDTEGHVTSFSLDEEREAEFYGVYVTNAQGHELHVEDFKSVKEAQDFIGSGLKRLTPCEIETFADVADVVFTEVRKRNGSRDFDSRMIPELIHRLACEFEKIYKDKDWSEDDYLGTVEDWTEAHAAAALKDLAIECDKYNA